MACGEQQPGQVHAERKIIWKRVNCVSQARDHGMLIVRPPPHVCSPGSCSVDDFMMLSILVSSELRCCLPFRGAAEHRSAHGPARSLVATWVECYRSVTGCSSEDHHRVAGIEGLPAWIAGG